MKNYHVEILDPVEIIIEDVRARSGRAAVEIALMSAGFAGYHRSHNGAALVDAPPNKRPVYPVYTNGKQYIHTVAWRETV